MHLIVSGGLFAFERGEYQGSGLEKLLPVVYEKSEHKVPFLKVVRNAKISGEGTWVSSFAKTADLQLNNIAPGKDSKVLLSVNGNPFVWTKPVGKGRITIIAGNIIANEQTRKEKTKAWDSLLMDLIQAKDF
jgi:hypothetical protein